MEDEFIESILKESSERMNRLLFVLESNKILSKGEITLVNTGIGKLSNGTEINYSELKREALRREVKIHKNRNWQTKEGFE